MASELQPPLLGLCAPSGTGKTTLARRLIALLDARGLRVGVIKQARDDFDVDRPGKDSQRLRAAGVERLLLGSEQRSALIQERPFVAERVRAEPIQAEPIQAEPVQAEPVQAEPDLYGLLAEFERNRLDLILVEGFAAAELPKLELLRTRAPRPWPPRYPHDPWVIAVAAEAGEPLRPQPRQPLLDLNDPPAVCEFVCRYFDLEPAPATTGG